MEICNIDNNLNPLIWNQDSSLRNEVRDKILSIVDEFIEFANVPMDVVDIHILGSNAGYNYTSDSDLDVHIIVNFDTIDASKEILQALYNSKKSEFNSDYDISVHGIDIEIYVEDIKSNTISNGIYSVYNSVWIKYPSVIYSGEINLEPELSKLRDNCYRAMKSEDSQVIKNMINYIYMLRRNSLSLRGEQGRGNLIFKRLRSEGVIQDLYDSYNSIRSEELSLESYSSKTIYNITEMKTPSYEVSPRDAEIYKMRESGVKLKDIASRYNISTERARQIHRHIQLMIQYNRLDDSTLAMLQSDSKLSEATMNNTVSNYLNKVNIVQAIIDDNYSDFEFIVNNMASSYEELKDADTRENLYREVLSNIKKLKPYSACYTFATVIAMALECLGKGNIKICIGAAMPSKDKLSNSRYPNHVWTVSDGIIYDNKEWQNYPRVAMNIIDI